MDTVRRRVVGPDEPPPADAFYLDKPDERTPLNRTALREAERLFKGRAYREHLRLCLDFAEPHGDARIRRLADGQYAVDGLPGFCMLPGAVPAAEQPYWLEQAFGEYMRPPNASNLDALYGGLPACGLHRHPAETVAVLPRGAAAPLSLDRMALLRRVRWTTLGYQYDWTAKAYDFAARPAAFPPALAALAARLAQAAGFAGFRAEAGIVNYYQLADTLTSHVDRSELNMAAPLLSLSLGCSCVFLVGGPGRDDPVTPLLLRSGDVAILAGPSRLAYHGVPRVLPGTLPAGLEAFAPIRDARININIRQVT